MRDSGRTAIRRRAAFEHHVEATSIDWRRESDAQDDLISDDDLVAVRIDRRRVRLVQALPPDQSRSCNGSTEWGDNGGADLACLVATSAILLRSSALPSARLAA
jgi:hypothetical protein